MASTINVNRAGSAGNKSGASSEAPLHVALLALALILIAAPFFFTTDGEFVRTVFPFLPQPPDSPCIMRLLTGYRCPACGMTRSFIYMSRLHIARAAAMNPAGPLLYGLCAFELPYRSALLIRGGLRHEKVLRIAELLLVMAFFITDITFFIIQFI